MSEKRRDKKGRVLRAGETQRPDGQYMFRYVDPSGKRKAVYSWQLVNTDKIPDGKRCKAALRDLEKQIQRDLSDGIRGADADSMTVNDLFQSFMNLRADLRETSRISYRNIYRRHVAPVIGDKRIGAVRTSDVKKLYIDMMQKHGLQSATVRIVHAVLYQVFETATQDNIIRTNPASTVLKGLRKFLNTETKKRHALTEDEQKIFVDYVYSSERHRRFGPLITVLLGTGMRIGEALGLRWDDVDFDNNLISVNHVLVYNHWEGGGYENRISSPKTNAGNRMIPMFSDVKNTLLAERDKPSRRQNDYSIDGYSDFIFLNRNGTVFSQPHIFSALHQIVVDYNEEEACNAAKEGREPVLLPAISAHILRHTFCTRLCENEPNIKVVQDIMGHKTIQTTMDVYNEATAVKKQASFKELDGKIKLV